MKRVLVVEDEIETGDVIKEMLQPHFEVQCATSGKEALQKAISDRPHLILLDVNLPDMNGFEICKKLREHPGNQLVPIIMLTRYSELDSKIKGFDLGADDYLTKPFQSRELLARVSSKLRRQKVEETEVQTIRFGDLTIDQKSQQVFIKDKFIHLTQLEFELLRYFLKRPNEVIPRQKLLGDLWLDTIVSDRTVDTHVANLRKKIKEAEFPLATIYGAGYILRVAPNLILSKPQINEDMTASEVTSSTGTESKKVESMASYSAL